MMIPPVLGVTPTKETGETPGAGFNEAMAAALGTVTGSPPGTAQLSPPGTAPLSPPSAPQPIEPGANPQVSSTTTPAIHTPLIPAPAPTTHVADQIARLLPPGDADRPTVPVAIAAPANTAAAPVAAADTERLLAKAPTPVSDLPGGEALARGDAELLEPELPVAAASQQPAESASTETELSPVQPTPAQPPVVTEQRVDALSQPPAIDPAATTGTEPGRGDATRPAQAALEEVQTNRETLSTRPSTDVPDGRRLDGPTTQPETRGSSPTPAATPGADPTAGISGVDAQPAPSITGDLQTQTTSVPESTLRRVEEAVRRLENAPPPRSITIAVDDHGVHRVTVSLLADGVRLTVPDGGTTDPRLVQQMEHALESRGFDMSGGRQRQPPDDRDPADTFRPQGFQPQGSHPKRPDGEGLRL